METYLTIAGGLVLLVAGSEMLVRGAVSIARMLHVSLFLIGLTLVAWGMSTPVLVTSVTAALAGSPGIVVGNIVGTDTANILLILGLAINPNGFRRDAIVVVATSLALLALVFHGSIGRLAGTAMVAAVIAYAVYAYRSEKAGPTADNVAGRPLGERTYAGPRRAWLALALCAIGLVAVIAGSGLLVDGAIALARMLMISETVIGLTVVAVGTSAPELTMGLIAAWRRQPDITYANIIGSHIYNTLFILGVAALAQSFAIPAQIARFYIWVMLAATSLLVFFTRSGFKLSRWEGLTFLTAYPAYVWYLILLSTAA